MTGEHRHPHVISAEFDPGRSVTIQTTIARHPGWKAELTFVQQGGTWVVASARALPHDWAPGARHPDAVPPGGITAAVMRSIPLAEAPKLLASQGVAGARKVGDLVANLFGEELREELERLPRAGRRGRGDDYYARWAALYVEALEAGSSRPNADLAERFHHSAATVRDTIHEATRRGLLTPPARRGTSLGRTLTDKARALLGIEEDR